MLENIPDETCPFCENGKVPTEKQMWSKSKPHLIKCGNCGAGTPYIKKSNGTLIMCEYC